MLVVARSSPSCDPRPLRLLGTCTHAYLMSKSAAPCKKCPEAGQPLPSGRRMPLLFLKMFSHHGVPCSSPWGLRGLTHDLPWKFEASQLPSLPELMTLLTSTPPPSGPSPSLSAQGEGGLLSTRFLFSAGSAGT